MLLFKRRGNGVVFFGPPAVVLGEEAWDKAK